MSEGFKNAAEAYQLATVMPTARWINVCQRLRPEPRFFRGDERDRRALNTSAALAQGANRGRFEELTTIGQTRGEVRVKADITMNDTTC